MSRHTYCQGWRRILQRAGLTHVGTHGIRHRSATDIANSGTPLKVGMALTAHKTVTMFMRYVHTEDDQVRAAAEAVAQRRQSLIGIAPAPAPLPTTSEAAGGEPPIAPMPTTNITASEKPLEVGGRQYGSSSKLENYRPFRHRSGKNRSVQPGTKRAEGEKMSHD